MPISFINKNGNKLHPPKTIVQAIERIVEGLEPAEKKFIKENSSATIHFTTGMSIRNEWGFWKDDSPIKRDFIQRFKLFGHADDMSGIILEGVWASVNGKDVEKTLTETAERFRKHWKKEKINPETGERL